jgi:outer membrane receptor protein involved in Fe transport
MQMKPLSNKYIIAFLLLALFPIGLTAQTKLTGKIVNTDDIPVCFAEIVLFSTDNIEIKRVFSDENGNFTIEEKTGNYLLLITQWGNTLYHKEITLKNDTNLETIKINTELILDEVVVNSRRPVFKQEYDKFIFNVENSPLKQGYDGLEVIKRSPKLQVNSQGDILLRNERAMVMINGRKMNFSGQELSNYLSSLNSENIKSIEIQTVGSAETDASNSGGVINIILKKPPTGFQSAIKTFYMHRNKDNKVYFGGITNQFGSEKWNIYNKINYRDDSNLSKYNSTTNFYINNGKNENEGTSNSRSKNFNTTTGIVFYPNENHEIGTEFYFSNDKSDRKGIEQINVFNPDLNAIATNNSANYNKINFWNIILNYSYKLDNLGSQLKFIGDIGNNDFKNQNEVDTRYSFGTLTDNFNRFITFSNSDFLNIQTDWNQKFKNNWEFSTGVKLSKVSRKNQLNAYLFDTEWQPTPNGQENFKNDENVLANYFTFATKWKNKHQLKIGLRTEYTTLNGYDFINNTKIKQNYFDLFPNLYYNYEIQQNQNIALSYSRRIQRPSFRDLNPFIIKQNDFLFQIGNPDLQPQYTNKIDLTYQYKNQSFSLYGDFTENLIAGVYTAENNISYYKPQNFGKSRNLGFDYSYFGDLTKWLYSNISLGVWHYNFELNDIKHKRFSFYISTYSQIKFSKTLFLDIFNSLTSANQFQVSKGAKQYRMDLALQKNIWKNAGIIRLSWEDVFNTQRDKNQSFYETFTFKFYQKRLTQSVVLMFIYTFKNKGKINDKNVQQNNENKNRL